MDDVEVFVGIPRLQLLDFIQFSRPFMENQWPRLGCRQHQRSPEPTLGCMYLGNSRVYPHESWCMNAVSWFMMKITFQCNKNHRNPPSSR